MCPLRPGSSACRRPWVIQGVFSHGRSYELFFEQEHAKVFTRPYTRSLLKNDAYQLRFRRADDDGDGDVDADGDGDDDDGDGDDDDDDDDDDDYNDDVDDDGVDDVMEHNVKI